MTDSLGCIEAERALLSSAWLTQDEAMIGKLHDSDFIDKFNKWLLRTLQSVVQAGEPLDAVAVSRRIKADRSAPKDALAEAYQLLTEAPTTAHKDYYFKVLRMERGRRYLHQLCERAKERDGANPTNPLETFLWMQQCVEQAIEQLKAV